MRLFVWQFSLLAAVCCPAEMAQAATQVVPVQAKATKPLTLTSVQDLDLGTIVLAPGTWTGVISSAPQAMHQTVVSSSRTSTSELAP